MPEPKAKRRFQFSLRTMLVVVALVGSLAALWHACTSFVEPYRRQREVIDLVIGLGGMCHADPAEGWIRYLDDTAVDVRIVNVANCNKPDDYLPQVTRLPRLRALFVGGHSFNDRHLHALLRLEGLATLNLDDTDISDDGLAHVAMMKDLRSLSVSSTRITAAGLKHIVGLPLIEFDAEHTHVGNEGMAVLASIPTLERLDLMDTQVTDEGLRSLQGNTTLKYLWLAGTSISDKDAGHLEACTELLILDVRRTNLSSTGFQRLKEALPRCEVRY